jgi:hypothetical protein
LPAFLVLCGGARGAAVPQEPAFFARHDYLELLGQSVGVADTNGDGILDLISVNGFVQVAFGNGDGTFRPGPLSKSGMSLAFWFVAADLNGNGKVDLVFSGGLHGTTPPLGIGVSFGAGNGGFRKVVFYPAGDETGIGNIVMGDFNGDGIPDAVVVGNSGVWLFTGKGSGVFNPAVLVTPLPTIEGGYVAVADFNGDHKLDLVVTMPFGGMDSNGNGSVVLFGNGDGTFQSPLAIPVPVAAVAVASGPLTKRGYPGIALLASNTSDVYLYLQRRRRRIFWP